MKLIIVESLSHTSKAPHDTKTPTKGPKMVQKRPLQATHTNHSTYSQMGK